MNPFRIGQRVRDNEGDTGTVTRVEGTRVYVDGDAGTTEWSYHYTALTPITEEGSE